MYEETEDIFDLSLMVDEILRPRLLMQPYSHPHREPLGKLEDIFICFVITNEKQTGLLQVMHEGQGGRSLPVFPRGQDIHRGFPKDQARRRRKSIEQEDQLLPNSGGLLSPSIVEGKSVALIFNLNAGDLEWPDEVCVHTLHPCLTDLFRQNQRSGGRKRA